MAGKAYEHSIWLDVEYRDRISEKENGIKHWRRHSDVGERKETNRMKNGN